MNQPQVLPDFNAAAGACACGECPTTEALSTRGMTMQGAQSSPEHTQRAPGGLRQRTNHRLALVKFSDFHRRCANIQAQLQDKTVVSFCTGGIRCEKAAICNAAVRSGRVYRLDGGVTEYQLSKLGGAHFRGLLCI